MSIASIAPYTFSFVQIQAVGTQIRPGSNCAHQIPIRIIQISLNDCRNIKALRCQLPRRNGFYEYEPSSEEVQSVCIELRVILNRFGLHCSH